uniref:Putative secreted protein n=1 Tax=Ixodes ricinus TaxID=34613 RepID=A0A6B0TYD7_IXORI
MKRSPPLPATGVFLGVFFRLCLLGVFLGVFEGVWDVEMLTAVALNDEPSEVLKDLSPETAFMGCSGKSPLLVVVEVLSLYPTPLC